MSGALPIADNSALLDIIPFFYIDGPVLYVDENDNVVHVDDNLGLIRQCREHFDKVGLGADFVDQFIR